MQLYIRGSWKSFSPRPKGSVDDRRPVQQQRSSRSMKNRMTDASIHLREESDNGLPPRLMVLFTGNLPRLRKFYCAFAGLDTAASQDENKCVLRLGPKQYVMLVNQEDENRRENKRHVEVGLLQDKPSTERRRKAVAVDVGSVEALLISYGRVKGHGIMRIQTSIDGTTATVRFEDPDGNEVELYSNLPKSAKCCDLKGEDGSDVSGRSMIETDPDVFVERLRLWKATSTVREAEFDKYNAACVKSEPIMAG